MSRRRANSRLHPGEAIYLPAGNLPAYLSGTAVEVMATSDNVLHGGLTGKHVDVDGLLGVLDARALPAPRGTSVPTTVGYAYPTPAPHVMLERLVPGSEGLMLERRGPEILLAIGAPAQVRTDGVGVGLASGQAAFVRADALEVRVEGDGAGLPRDARQRAGLGVRPEPFTRARWSLSVGRGPRGR